MAQQYSTLPSAREINRFVKLAEVQRNQYLVDSTITLV
jgi:hypothetical protein